MEGINGPGQRPTHSIVLATKITGFLFSLKKNRQHERLKQQQQQQKRRRRQQPLEQEQQQQPLRRH